MSGITSQAIQTDTGEKKVYAPLPDGEYLVTVDRVSEGPSKDGLSYSIKASFKVPEGDHKGRLIFNNFLMNHQNRAKNYQDAVKAGKDNLDKMLKALGVSGGFAGVGNDASQISEFIGKELIVSVTTQKGRNGYPDTNKVTKWIRR